ncbi:protein CREG1 [Condylostylus longicornis]|uniref:protein CREG1 n=1 Tax=Condylostylus longicornis TaxID=2530218 RepID=UPI00244DC4D9|nr:protein CREG1 [Condylostylus longicornis]XP_055380527.1 protein CREG1 [Condylostylus longicornis]
MLRAAIYLLMSMILFNQSSSYSVVQDERIIRSYLEPKAVKERDHAKVARNLVHKSKWASIGTRSTDSNIQGYPMVNIMSISDGIVNEKSTGVIYFLSTTLDFTGQDLLVDNRATLMISDDEDLHCSKQNIDPMEPVCPRVHISGNMIKMDESFPDYKVGLDSIIRLHPAALNWIKAHASFSLFKVDIKNIYVLDYYGGPHNVSLDKYYATQPDNSEELPVKAQTELKQSLDKYFSKNEVNIRIPKNKYKTVNIIL